MEKRFKTRGIFDRERCATTFIGVRDRAKQSMKDQCDINLVMGRYLRSGQIDHFAQHGASYGFADSASFHDCMNIVVRAEEMFADLPAATRRRFGNSPGAFLDFIKDEANLPEMRKLGLALPEKAPEFAAEELEEGGEVEPPARPAAPNPPRRAAVRPPGTVSS